MIIRLDARVSGVIAHSVFRAELVNGHEIVAYAARSDRERFADLERGSTVTVEMSPYDMSRGRILTEKYEGFENEGKKFSKKNM